MLKRVLAVALASSAATLSLASVATASESVATAAPAAQAQALRAVRDKVTGKLRAPTADETKAMQDAERAARKARGLPEVEASRPTVVVQHANGMRSAVLGTEYMVTLKATRQTDGSLAVTHDDPAHEHPKPSAAPNAAPTK